MGGYGLNCFGIQLRQFDDDPYKAKNGNCMIRLSHPFAFSFMFLTGLALLPACQHWGLRIIIPNTMVKAALIQSTIDCIGEIVLFHFHRWAKLREEWLFEMGQSWPWLLAPYELWWRWWYESASMRRWVDGVHMRKILIEQLEDILCMMWVCVKKMNQSVWGWGSKNSGGTFSGRCQVD